LIRGAFAHLPGIGPERLRRLRQAGIEDWRALTARPGLTGLGPAGRARLSDAVARCEAAVQADDIAFLVEHFKSADRWRVLAAYFERATFFDIETSGLDLGSRITLIACLHRGRLHRFVQGESLDGFLVLLDEVELLVSFNGASFDVPRVEEGFHIPACPCPHVDLRWLCYHAELRGGLKAIEREMGIERPDDLATIDGEQAEWLWTLWEQDRDLRARITLERYCGADVLALKLVAARLLAAHACSVMCESQHELWGLLPPPEPVEPPKPAPPPVVFPASAPAGSPQERRLRAAWQRRRAGAR
jgi:uncharacterized protein YprB with RNaseH-like and TPR domain